MPNRTLPVILLLTACIALFPAPFASGVAFAQKAPVLPQPLKKALETVSAEDLEGRVSFLASDALEGRGTPSKGLEIAAEYIASEFRRAGLEPVGKDGYFQNATITARRRGGGEETFTARNVVGLLPGSDPKLKETYILVTAHYDHLGVRPGDGDQIYNGANDDASGVVGMIEVASVLAKMQPRPKRSVLFIAFFGEERGLLGSRHYGRNPLVPLEKTIAQVNLEQIGRTDDSEGPRVGAANVTGFDYSDVGTVLQQAGTLTGVRVEKHPTASDAYFGRSDNQALADLGIPAHTVSVAYSFPDYHRATDHWDKLDYANMAKVVRMIAAGVVLLAESPTAPQWNADNPRTERYRNAKEKTGSTEKPEVNHP
ncbi:MAG: M28 family metallopeptidase [Armatimonadaceae bacterium]